MKIIAGLKCWTAKELCETTFYSRKEIKEHLNISDYKLKNLLNAGTIIKLGRNEYILQYGKIEAKH